MSKKRFKKGVRSLKKEIDIHKAIKLEKAFVEGKTELAGYYQKEIKRLEEQLLMKEQKLLPRKKIIKGELK